MTNDTNDIKHKDATQLCVYLNNLNYSERIAFVTDVVDATGINRRTFFNWKYMCCCIPKWAKEKMEGIAGCTIFSKEITENILINNE